MTKDEALDLALDALTYIHAETSTEEDRLIDKAITAIEQARSAPVLEPVDHLLAEITKLWGVIHNQQQQLAAQPAPVQPDWKSEYQKSVELHCITLDELREADAWIKNLEKLMADQDVMLTRQAARIVDLQTHIANLEGED